METEQLKKAENSTEEELLNEDFKNRLSEIENLLSQAKKKFQTDKASIRMCLTIIGIFSIFILLHIFEVFVLPLWFLIICIIILLLFIIALVCQDTYKSKLEIDKYESIKKIHLGFPISKSVDDEYYNSLLKMNLENLSDYYVLVKSHTAKSFHITLILIILGFILICSGLIASYCFSDMISSYLISGAGIIIEFISCVLFFLYNKTIRQLKEYHDSLLRVQNILVSFRLVEAITDENARGNTITKMIESIIK
ncbi:hypothetical protein AGMMS50239_01050 [Bacteroidia bacterium]|nr:hypothetical protein AGMMS50239_01050 [Bacteroidia bacterium]GHU63490.1 hypothetical protein FACS1894123_06360 [Bacteroidia bacterium]